MDKAPALLGLIADGASHGYDLKQRFDAYFGAERPIAFGQIYSTIARMIRDGYIQALGEEPGDGPDRKRYGVTASGREYLHSWLSSPDEPAPTLQSNLFAKTVVALLVDDDADALLDIQRHAHLARMRDLTRAKQSAPPLERLAIDHALFVIEADLRWIDLASARLADMRQEIRRHA